VATMAKVDKEDDSTESDGEATDGDVPATDTTPVTPDSDAPEA